MPRLFHRALHIVTVIFTMLVLSAALSSADPVTQAQAQKAVEAWLAGDSCPLDTPLGSRVSSVQSFAGDKGSPAYYIASLDPEGFVVVSADDLVEPIIAFAPEGTYELSTDNPLAALVMQDVPCRVAQARDEVANAAKRGRLLSPHGEMLTARGKWLALLASEVASPRGSVAGLANISDVRVAPFVTSKWNQTTDRCSGYTTYNYYTPSGYYCGCVPTAMAMLMRYWQFPSAGVGTGSYMISVCGGTQYAKRLMGGNGSGGPYVWSEMDLDPCTPDLATRQAIGRLCHDAGLSVNVDYCSGGTATDTLKCADAFKNTFGFSNAVNGWNNTATIPLANLYAMINPNLHAGCPVIVGIFDGSAGHAVVCDGYGYQSSTVYHHLNLGWGGSYTAWYNLPTVDAGYPFTSVWKMVYNIFTSGTGEIIAGRVTTSAGTAVSGATVTAGSFTDTTDARGIYALAAVASGTTYTVSVTKAGYVFTPQSVTTGTSTSWTTACGNKWGVDFVGTAQIAAPTMNSEPAWTAGTTNDVSWSAVSGATGYYVEWDTAGDFATPDGNSGWITGTSYTVPGLADGGLYYYHVKCKDSASESVWSGYVSSGQDDSGPSITSVEASPYLALPGWNVFVTVSVSDPCGVGSVTVDGVAAHLMGYEWHGATHAASTTGYHSVNVVVTDTLGHASTDTSHGYTTGVLVTANVRSLGDPIMSAACSGFMFRVCGTVAVIDDYRFSLDDGSGGPIIVYAPGYPQFIDGETVSATGAWEPMASPSRLRLFGDIVPY